MDKYYFLISELPYLIFGEEPAVTRRYFLEEARKWLYNDDFQSLIQANINEFSIDEKIIPQVLYEYRFFENKLRSELVLWREARQQGNEYKSILFPQSLVKEGNPLQIERNFLFFRWKFIEELEIGHCFDVEAVILYYLKLQILERLFSFNKEKGSERFKQLIESSFEDNISEVV